MANEIVIEEFGEFTCKFTDGKYVSIPGKFLTSQVLDLGELSAQFNPATQLIHIINNGSVDIWYQLGNNTITPSANSDGSRLIPSGIGIWTVSVDARTDTHFKSGS